MEGISNEIISFYETSFFFKKTLIDHGDLISLFSFPKNKQTDRRISILSIL